MTVDKKEIKHIAELLNLEMDDSDLEQFKKEISDLIEHFQKLDELDLEDVEPMSHARDIHCPERDDGSKDSQSRSETLSNSPSRKENFFKVPPVMEEE